MKNINNDMHTPVYYCQHSKLTHLFPPGHGFNNSPLRTYFVKHISECFCMVFFSMRGLGQQLKKDIYE